MQAYKLYKELSSQVVQPKRGGRRTSFKDNRLKAVTQAKLINNIQNDVSNSISSGYLYGKYSHIIQMCGRIIFCSQIDQFYFPSKKNVAAIFNAFLKNDDATFGGKHVHVPYDAEGKQKATTTIGWGWEGEEEDYDESFSTETQMHSEMRAIEFGLNEDFLEIQGGKVVYGVGAPVSSRDMRTDIPHCRFCTFFLGLLGIEREKPTTQNFLYAGHLDYPLPEDIKYNESIINKAAELFGYADVNDALNSILPKRAGKVINLFTPEFECVIATRKGYDRLLIDQFWKSVFKIIGEVIL